MPSRCKYIENGIQCETSASFGPPDTKQRLYCKKHAPKDMVNSRIDNRVCNHPDHKGKKAPRASFGLPREKPTRCKEHVERGMISASQQNPCEICKINTRTHGKKGEKPRFCKKCAELSEHKNELEDLRKGKCKECKKWAIYGNPPNGPREYCKSHKKLGMIDIKNTRCEICVEEKSENPKQATFGYDKAIRCVKHKTSDMKDLKHNSKSFCEKCGVRASYGYMYPSACRKHAEFGMEIFYGQKCEGCKITQGIYSLEKGGKLYCLRCKTDEMKRVKGNFCVVCDKKQPTFNFEGKKPEYCGDCKDPLMIDVLNPRCKSCKYFIVHKPKEYCSQCDPDCIAYKKLKENVIWNFLKEKYDKNMIVYNKKISMKDVRIFPDFRIYPEEKTHVVVLEVDEYQHKKGEEYDICRENERMRLIAKAEKLPCIFLRYNPDVYRVNGKKKICPENERLTILGLKLEKFLNKKTFKKDMYVYRLFYDIEDEDEEINEPYFQKYDIEGFFRELEQKKELYEKLEEKKKEENEEHEEHEEQEEDEENQENEDEEDEDSDKDMALMKKILKQYPDKNPKPVKNRK